ncbi:Crp/Fnr family transcriptional regulator [Elioraea rosea]|uniref:Crp/Fnr family transcriptional regulator n=1 Tax=Elioraea rosea TaxID=2492390 RepID=UPI00118301FF|nr:Crp/Fnr family transcriptional regulator [Elioraea rosea]
MRAATLDPPFPCTHCPLRPLPGFIDGSAEERTFIARRKLGQLHVVAGGTILPEGQPAQYMFTLLSGWAFRYKTLSDGRRQIMNVLLPGDLVGLQSHMLDSHRHSVEALTDVSLCTFGRETVWAIYKSHPPLGFALTWLAAHEERLVDDAILSVGRRSAVERIAALMVHIFKRAEAAGLKQGDAIPFPLTQEHVADALGLSIVHTNRTIQHLRRAGLIRLADGTLSIGDLRALRRVALYWEQPAEPRPLF